VGIGHICEILGKLEELESVSLCSEETQRAIPTFLTIEKLAVGLIFHYQQLVWEGYRNKSCSQLR
jgi:hypothetical protein